MPNTLKNLGAIFQKLTATSCIATMISLWLCVVTTSAAKTAPCSGRRGFLPGLCTSANASVSCIMDAVGILMDAVGVPAIRSNWALIAIPMALSLDVLECACAMAEKGLSLKTLEWWPAPMGDNSGDGNSVSGISRYSSLVRLIKSCDACEFDVICAVEVDGCGSMSNSVGDVDE